MQLKCRHFFFKYHTLNRFFFQVIFKGHWSRMTHPRKYPTKPDNNGYSHLVGASHTYKYILWQPDVRASEGLKLLAEEANISLIERDIINAVRSFDLILDLNQVHTISRYPAHSRVGRGN